MSIHQFPAPDPEMLQRRNITAYQEIRDQLRGLARSMDAETLGIGGRYENANFEAFENSGRRIAYITALMRKADAGAIGWDFAWANTMAILEHKPDWLCRSPDYEQKRVEVNEAAALLKRAGNDLASPVPAPAPIKRDDSFFELAKSICAPPRIDVFETDAKTRAEVLRPFGDRSVL